MIERSTAKIVGPVIDWIQETAKRFEGVAMAPKSVEQKEREFRRSISTVYFNLVQLSETTSLQASRFARRDRERELNSVREYASYVIKISPMPPSAEEIVVNYLEGTAA